MVIKIIMENKEKNAFEQINECIDKNKSFILEAGAGSWKTYTLIQTIQHLLKIQSNDFLKNWQKIACITYTNTAKDELIERLDYNELVEINTIHEFLWSIINNYQVNLKKELLIYNETFDSDKIVENLESILDNKDVIYTWKYWRNFEKWILHHDDVIYLSIKLLEKYPKLQQILIWKYPYFFIDEYQDTSKGFVEILLNILESNKKQFLLWFFWDFMQKIYEKETVWKIEDDNLQIIQKIENYRSQKKVVKLINNIRKLDDDLIQIPQEIDDWSVKLYYSDTGTDNEEKYNIVKEKLEWDFEWNPRDNKILVLSNTKISKDLWFNKLLQIFNTRFWGQNWNDRLKQKEEPYTSFLLDKVEKIIYLYNEKNYSEFFKLFWDEDFKINTLEDRKKLKDLIIWLEKTREESISAIFEYIYKNKILVKSEKIILFEKRILEDLEEWKQKEKQEKDKKFQDELMNLNYKEIINYNQFLEKKTPYSTQHWTKWAEYKNVLLVIDDNPRWSFYNRFWKVINWEKLYKNSPNEDRDRRKHINLLYVSISRAKENIVILHLNNDNIEWWERIIWEENIEKI